eukprot:1065509-Rhodomonas_salina.2
MVSSVSISNSSSAVSGSASAAAPASMSASSFMHTPCGPRACFHTHLILTDPGPNSSSSPAAPPTAAW